jgi:hypothetical protein
LLAVQKGESTSVRSKVCEVAAEVARNLTDEDGNNQGPKFLVSSPVYKCPKPCSEGKCTAHVHVSYVRKLYGK